jgi:hypothetical protein
LRHGPAKFIPGRIAKKLLDVALDDFQPSFDAIEAAIHQQQ